MKLQTILLIGHDMLRISPHSICSIQLAQFAPSVALIHRWIREKMVRLNAVQDVMLHRS